MHRSGASSSGFAVLPVLIIVVAIIAIWFVGLRVWTSHYQVPSSLPGDHAPLTTSVNTPFPKGSDSNTFSFKTYSIFPDVPASYQQLYVGFSPINGVIVPPSQPQSGVEADYITTQPATSVHSDVITICNSHGFRFIESANDNTTVQCQAEVADWQFNIEPASNFIPQPWYKLDSISQAVLAKSTWLQVTTAQSQLGSPAEHSITH